MSNRLPPSQRPERKQNGDGLTGQKALEEWINRQRPWIQSAYRNALANGWTGPAFVFCHPPDESMDRPPVEALVLGPYATRLHVEKNHPAILPGISMAAPPGAFHVLASRGEGRFKGTICGVLPAAPEDEELPDIMTILAEGVPLDDRDATAGTN